MEYRKKLRHCTRYFALISVYFRYNSQNFNITSVFNMMKAKVKKEDIHSIWRNEMYYSNRQTRSRLNKINLIPIISYVRYTCSLANLMLM